MQPMPSETSRSSFPSSLAKLTWLFLRHPRRACDVLAEDPRALWLGMSFLLFGLLVYAGVSLLFFELGRRPASTPLLLFPMDRWYLVQAFITIPIGVGATFTYSGIAHAVCRSFGGRGTFSATFGSSAFSLHLPMLIFMWIPEIWAALTLLFEGGHALPWPTWVEVLRVFLIPLPWAAVISCVALARIHRLAWWKAGLAVVVAALPTSLVTATFLR
jgi:hypothetical protein